MTSNFGVSSQSCFYAAWPSQTVMNIQFRLHWLLKQNTRTKAKRSCELLEAGGGVLFFSRGRKPEPLSLNSETHRKSWSVVLFSLQDNFSDWILHVCPFLLFLGCCNAAPCTECLVSKQLIVTRSCAIGRPYHKDDKDTCTCCHRRIANSIPRSAFV